MALYSIKKIEAPLPQLATGTVHIRVTVIDKETGTQTVKHYNIDEDGDGYIVADLLTALDLDYTPNDFGV